MKHLRTIGLVVLIPLASLGLFVAGVFVLSILDQFWFHSAQRPPDGIQTVADFYRWQQPTGTVYRADIRGTTYYLVLGPYARVLPSEKSAYAFDATGNLVAWTVDIGDYREGIIKTFYENRFPTITADQFLRELKMTNATSNPVRQTAGSERE